MTQMDGQVSRSEGTSVTMNCTYSTSEYPALFWYVQYPGEGPQLLLKAMMANDKGTNKGFEATYNVKNHLLTLGENLSPRVRLGCVLLCSE